MKWYRPGDEIRDTFPTCNAAGNAAAPSSMVGVLLHNGIADEDVPVTLATIQAGLNSVVATIPEDYAAGDDVVIAVSATVDGVTAWLPVVNERLVGINFASEFPFVVNGPVTGQSGIVGEVVDGVAIVAYHYAPLELTVVSVLDGDGEPLDMSSYADDLAFVIFKPTGAKDVQIAELIDDDCVLDPDHPHQVLLSHTDLLTQTVGEFRWVLRRRTDGAKFVRSQGDFTVQRCAAASEPS